MKRLLALAVLLALAGCAFWWFTRQGPAVPLKPPAPPVATIPPPVPPPAPPKPPKLSDLGETPDWSQLDMFQETITREDFERLLTTVFTTGEGWREFISLSDQEARIRTGVENEEFILRFASTGNAKPAPRQWRSTAELPPALPDRPLEGLRVAIDPGHIGGQWARIEERWLKVGDTPPVCEGDMTLLVSQLLKPRLEALGATVSLVRENSEPITKLRPADLMAAAAESISANSPPDELRRTAERLFYRTAEIRDRAVLVNQTLKPDLVLCIHFNADPWGDSEHATLVNRTHLHLLVNGAYTDSETALADQRQAMLDKLLRRTHEEETDVSATVAEVFAQRSGLPPFLYPPGAKNVRQVNGNPYLWARNLLANRLYNCPVIYMEPYVMNSVIDHPRMIAGDYEGLREISGKPQPSLFREYADAMAEGLAKHYAEKRANAK